MQLAAEEKVYTEICYFCARLDPAVRGAHTFMECVKRTRASDGS